jgi:serine/threonine protein kinase/tetratricopeptide (TPR) repeat protein
MADVSTQPQGTVLAHYRILEQIGSGGMGVVYLAHDDILDRDVAIKVLPPGTLSNEAARTRFRKEALALAKLNHPNIATIHELGSQDDTDFLVTEFIRGITVDARLTSGPLPEREVVSLGLQLAHGLTAAHEQGVIHRDLKPGNLRLTPDGRLKILDFGLAQVIEPDNSLARTATLTQSQEVSGTLPYMSPEQLRGERSDARTDIWSAGAVLYEMATGRRPFEEKVPTALAGDILHTNPVAPCTRNPALSRRLGEVILKCLAKDPASRYLSAGNLAADLEQLSSGAVPVAALPRRAWRIASATALATALALTGIWYAARVTRPHPSSASVRRSVAVLGFKNLSGKPDTEWLSTALSELLTTELAAGGKLRTVPGETVAQMKLSLALPDAESFGKDTLAKIRQNLESDEVVLGSYIPLGNGQLRVDLRLQDAAAGETLATISEKGSEANLDELANKIGAELRAKLGVRGFSAGEAAGVRASMPANPSVARLYSEGLAKLRLADYLGARDLLQQVVAADPAYALSHSALSAAWSGLGYQQKAREEAKRAVDTSEGLSPEQRLWVEGNYRESTREFDKAIEIYRKLLEAAPDDIESGLRLAAAQNADGKSNESLATLQALRNLPSPLKDDPRIDLAEAVAAESVSDFKRESDLGSHAAATATAEGARLLIARARLVECSALDYLHNLDTAMRACREARSIYDSAGIPRGSVTALLNIGNIFADQGKLEQSTKAYEEALQISRKTGDQGSTAAALNNIAANLHQQGDLTGASNLYRQALAVKREVGARNEIARTLYNIGSVLTEQGALSGAEKMFDESLSISREIGDKEEIANAELSKADLFSKKGDLAGAQVLFDDSHKNYEQINDKDGATYSLVGTAGVLTVQGNLPAAQAMYLQALEILHNVDDKHGIADALSGQGDLLLIQGDSAGAAKKYEEALSIRKGLGERTTVAATQLALAMVALEEKRLTEAEVKVREALGEFRKQKLKDEQALGETILAEVLLASGRLAEARSQAEAAVSLATESQNQNLHFRVDTVAARARAASGKNADMEQATKLLEIVEADAAKSGFVQSHFEARMALAEIEMKSGETAAGRDHLSALEKEARDKGFLLIARRAATLRNR